MTLHLLGLSTNMTQSQPCYTNLSCGDLLTFHVGMSKLSIPEHIIGHVGSSL